MNYGLGQIRKMDRKDNKKSLSRLKRKRLYHSLMEVNIRKIWTK